MEMKKKDSIPGGMIISTRIFLHNNLLYPMGSRRS